MIDGSEKLNLRELLGKTIQKQNEKCQMQYHIIVLESVSALKKRATTNARSLTGLYGTAPPKERNLTKKPK